MLNKMLSRVATIGLELGHKAVFQSATRLTIVTDSSKVDVWFEDSSYHVFANSTTTGLYSEMRYINRDGVEDLVKVLLWGVL